MFAIKYRVSSVPLFTLQTEGQIMKFNQRRQLAQVAFFSLMALGADSAFAQTERPAPGLPSPSGQAGTKAERPAPGLPSPSGQAGISISPAQFSTSLQARERELASIEQLFTRIEAAKLPGEKERLFNELSQPLDAYAKGMMESSNTTLKQAELAAKTQGKEGSTGLLKPFEDLAVKHELKMKTLDERAQKIEIAGRPFKHYCARISGPAPGNFTTGFKCKKVDS